MSASEKLWLLLKQIPRGRITTYKILAEKLRTHPRALGRMLNTNPRPFIVPCHRVVRSDGRVGGYKFGAQKKIDILRHEGVNVVQGRIDLKRYLFGF